MVLGSQFTVHSPGGIKRHIGRRRGRTAGTRRGMCGGVVSASLCGCGGGDTASRVRTVRTSVGQIWRAHPCARGRQSRLFYPQIYLTPPPPLRVQRGGVQRTRHAVSVQGWWWGWGGRERSSLSTGQAGAGIGVVGDGGRPIGRPYRFVSTRDFG
jgi:hypothetical protein